MTVNDKPGYDVRFSALKAARDNAQEIAGTLAAQLNEHKGGCVGMADAHPEWGFSQAILELYSEWIPHLEAHPRDIGDHGGRFHTTLQSY